MPIAFDSVTNGNAADPATTLTYAHTAAGANRAAMVGMSNFQDPAPNPTCTYDGVSMVQEARITDVGVDMSALFSLIAPTTTVNANVAIADAGNNAGISSGCITLTGVNQTDATRAVASASAATVNVTSVADDWCLDALAKETAASTVGAGQTQRWNVTPQLSDSAGSTETATGASTTMSWTGGDFPSIIAASFVPAAAGGLPFLQLKSRPFPYKPGSPRQFR